MAPSGQIKPEGKTDTLIFLDVDGVLNIGIRDGTKPPLELSAASVTKAKTLWPQRAKTDPGVRSCIERIVEANNHELGFGEDATYGKFLSSSTTRVSDVLVERLANIIRAAGGPNERRQVVLASTWRHPRHSGLAKQLEQAVSHHLGRQFTFDARTSLWADDHAEGRLRAIGNFVEEYSNNHGPLTRLRVVVLDDFCVTPLQGWWMDGVEVNSVAAAEAYLQARIKDCTYSQVKVVHTYEEWTCPNGMKMQVGAGLKMEHFAAAIRFLEESGTGINALTDEGENDECCNMDRVPSKGNKCDKAHHMNWMRLPHFSLPSALKMQVMAS
mmetsp:Transcript_74487/g.177374  ORF Transcript_74487/g.177374 Transcript_74487/m.177374 type:complete len:327 (+) Transcript_74487:104-1084(+)